MTMTATYSPEDNKLRLYASSRLDDETYQRIKEAGFKWAPKQELFVAPSWTPAREDLLLELCGEIEDEDYSPEERSADRAERFSGYRDKRRSEAHGYADTFEAGPSAFGHQNRQRAERQAARHDRYRTRAVSQWSKAEYWQTRTEGVIMHALHKSSARVRRSRLVRLEAEQRKHEKHLREAEARYHEWKDISEMTGAEIPLPLTEEGSAIYAEMNDAQRKAYNLANGRGLLLSYHPTSHEANDAAKGLWHHGFSAYDFLTRTEFLGKPFERFTPQQYARLYLEAVKEPGSPGSFADRWSRHYELRIGYEKAMLEAEGGMVGNLEMEPGGWIRPSRRDIQFGRAVVNNDGWCQILRVNKSPKTGRVTSVAVLGSDPYLNDHEVKPRTIKVERLGEDSYRPPTDEEREAFKSKQAEAKRQAKAPKKPSLINPTDEDAERLQDFLNSLAKAKHDSSDSRHYKEYEPVEVSRMTQEQYSAASKGSYSHLETRTLHNHGGIMARRSSNLWSSEGSAYDKALGPAVCKVRTRCPSGFSYVTPQRIVIITDKPQKPLPLDWDNLGAELPESEPVEVH